MAYLQITLNLSIDNRDSAAGVYSRYKDAFLKTIEGAQSKQLLVRDEDVQVLHGFDSAAHASAYLDSTLFKNDVVRELGPLLAGEPDIRIYEVVA